MKTYETVILAKANITSSFNLFCLYDAPQQIKRSELMTFKLMIEVNHVRMHTLLQVIELNTPLIFMN